MLPYTDKQLLSLSPVALRTLLAIRVKMGSKMTLQATMEDLGTLTGYSRESLRKGILELQTGELLAVRRTKRNLGKLSVNEYSLPCQAELALSPEPCQPELASTAGKGSYIAISNSDTTISHTSNRKLKFKGIKVVNKWKDDGDEIAGFGLFGEETSAADKKKLSTDKRDPATRGRRPQEEWTTYDVAAEFKHQLNRMYPYIPALVNTKNLAGALAKYRKDNGTNALIELELLRMFMADPAQHADWQKNQMHMYLYKRYLKLFQTHMPQALRNLGMAMGMPTKQVDAVKPKVTKLVASDGAEFDNTIPGRKAFESYEQKLRANAE